MKYIGLFKKFLQRSHDRNLVAPGDLATMLKFRKCDAPNLSNKKTRFIDYINPKKIVFSTDFTQRAHFMSIVLFGVLVLLLSRYAWLALLPSDLRDKLRTQSTKQFETEITLAPPRAAVTDRNHRPLALTVLYPSIFVVPKRIPTDEKIRSQIATKLGITKRDLELYAKSRKGFAWVRRKITPKEMEKIGDLSKWREFVGIVEEPKRVYPEKELAAHLIGFVGMDNVGLEGVESIYNTNLNGEASTVPVTRDARGRLTLITPNGAARPEPSLPPLQLSIDLSIQQFAETALREGVEKARARGGSAVVLDAQTGELLAIASYPTYDLNNPPDNRPEQRRFRPIMDALELGSVVKPIFVSKALDLGVIHKDDRFFCENGKMAVPGGYIHDTHEYGWLTVSEIIKFSSNIGTYKIVQKMGRNTFHDVVIHSGLGRLPGTGLPGEWGGRISAPQTWREMRFANLAFGQGIAISPLQLTHAISMITAGGEDKGVRLLPLAERTSPPVGPKMRYISPTTSRTITEMMMSVVEEEGGTGRLAAVPGVTVAGKTGTAQKFSQKTRSYSERTSSFTGVIPAENPKLAITVVIDEPQVRPAYGGTLAGPVFSSIGTQTLRYLNSQGFLSLESSQEGKRL